MTGPLVRKLDFRKRPLRAAAGLLAAAVPVMFAVVYASESLADSQAQDAAAVPLVYDVASIKPNKSGSDRQGIFFPPSGFKATNVTMHMLIRVAYGVDDNQVSQEPNWLKSENYDVEAKMDSSVADARRKLSEDQRKLERQRMLQALLADRFKLTLHRETKELPVYALVIAKNGPKLRKSKPGDAYANGIKGLDGLPAGPDMMLLDRGQVTGQARPMASLAGALARLLGRKVLDKTGLKGDYDFILKWTPDESEPFKEIADNPRPDNTPQRDPAGPSVFAAIQEQLGLKLDSQKASADVLVIDHVERPSEN